MGAGRPVARPSRDIPVEIRLLKLAEEVGEAAEALIGIAADVDEAAGHLERRLAVVTARAGL